MALTYPNPRLEDGVVLLRPWEEQDLAVLERASRDDYVAEIEHLPVPFDDERGREWIARQHAHRENGRGWTFAIVDLATGETVGGVGLSFRHPPGAAEPGVWVVAEKRGHGIAERAARLLCHWALTTETGIGRVQATVEPWNLPSQRVLEKLGFVREGLLRSYASWRGSRQDVLLYSLLPGDLDAVSRLVAEAEPASADPAAAVEIAPLQERVASSFDQFLDEAESRPARGWDFSWLGDRIVTSPLPWSFEEIVLRHVPESPDLLDLGTGGGEWLAALPQRPPRTVATEAWPPNVEVAGTRLRPLGITVVAVEAAPDNVEQRRDEKRGRLPFPASSFSLISNRHESFLAHEVARVLVAGGTFLAQQVGGDYDAFYDALDLPRPGKSQRRWDLRFATQQLAAAGLRVVEGQEGVEETSFADAGALAWYLKAIPWVVENFSIARYRPQLRRLQERIETTGPLTLRQPAFWLKAVKDA